MTFPATSLLFPKGGLSCQDSLM